MGDRHRQRFRCAREVVRIHHFPLPEVNFSGHGHCEFTDVVPNERLAYRFTTPESSLNLQATWTLHPESGGTRLLVVHNGFDVGNPVHGRLRILVRDLWKLVVSRIAELMAEPKDDAVPPPDDSTSFTPGRVLSPRAANGLAGCHVERFVGDVVNDHDLVSVRTGARLTIGTYPIPLIGFGGRVDMEFLEV